MGRINAETEHVHNLIAKHKGYDQFRGNKRLANLHKAFDIVSSEVDKLYRELYDLPYEIWFTNEGKTTRIARGFDTIASAEKWIAAMDRGQGRFDIYHIS